MRANGLLSVCFLFFFSPSEGPSDRVVTNGSGFSLVEMRIFSSGCTPFFSGLSVLCCFVLITQFTHYGQNRKVETIGQHRSSISPNALLLRLLCLVCFCLKRDNR